MRIINLIDPQSMIYSSNVYLILGDWSAIDDVNTLIDVGNDPALIARIHSAPTGVGKQAVEQVIFTHGHFDHTGNLPQIREEFAPIVYAQSPFAEPDRVLMDGQQLKCGDRQFEVIYSPGHSDDSICLYCQTDGVLFVGDTPVVIRSTDQMHEARFLDALERLCKKDVRTIYSGHDNPITQNAQQILEESLRNARSGSLSVIKAPRR